MTRIFGRFVRTALEKEGMSIAEAKSAEDARIDSACRRPELMIVDLGLRDGDGKGPHPGVENLVEYTGRNSVVICS